MFSFKMESKESTGNCEKHLPGTKIDIFRFQYIVSLQNRNLGDALRVLFTPETASRFVLKYRCVQTIVALLQRQN